MNICATFSVLIFTFQWVSVFCEQTIFLAVNREPESELQVGNFTPQSYTPLESFKDNLVKLCNHNLTDCCLFNFTQVPCKPDSTDCFSKRSKVGLQNVYLKGKENQSSGVIQVVLDAFCIKAALQWFVPTITSPSTASSTRRSVKYCPRYSSEEWSDSTNIPATFTDNNTWNEEVKPIEDAIMVVSSGSPLSSKKSVITSSTLGRSIKLACLFSGDPDANDAEHFGQVIWKKNHHDSEQQLQGLQEVYKVLGRISDDTEVVDVLTISVLSINSSGRYSCHEGYSQSEAPFTFEVYINNMPIEGEFYRIKRPNLTGFIIGMVPSIVVFFCLIMRLGYRSRYATDEEEEEEEVTISQFAI